MPERVFLRLVRRAPSACPPRKRLSALNLNDTKNQNPVNLEHHHPRKKSFIWGAIPVALVMTLNACDDEADSSEASADEMGMNVAFGSMFVVPTQVYGPDFLTSTSFVPLVPSLDVARIGLEQAREWDGRASVLALGSWLFIASSSEPVIHRFGVEPDGSLTEAGRLGFSDYGVPSFFSIDPWGNIPISPTKAYIFNGSDGGHVVWNPTTFEILGEIAAPDVVRDGWNLESIGVVRGNRLFRVFSYLDYDAWRFDATTQVLAVYDVETDQLLELVQDARCPLLYSRPFEDESGALYFSGWVWTPAETLVHGAPKNCALRILPGQTTFDPAWQLNYADEITEGREGGILRYLGGGKALLDVFHHERVTITAETSSQELSNTAHWRLWAVDLEQRTGAPVEGLDFKAGGYQDVAVDGRTFLMVPNADYSETTAYEVMDGQAVPGFKIQGSAYHMAQLW